MNNREVEVIILEEIEKLNPKFKIYPSCDFKYIREIELPRVVSITYLNKIISTHNEVEDIDDNYVGVKEINTIKHSIRLIFSLNKDISFDEIEIIRGMLKHKIGRRYQFKLEKKDILIVKVGDIQDVSEHTPSTYFEKYSIDIEVNSFDIYTEMLEKVKKVNFKIKRG